MLDIKDIRNRPDRYAAMFRLRKLDIDVETVLAEDEEVRRLKTNAQTLQSDLNTMSREIGTLYREGNREAGDEAKKAVEGTKWQLSHVTGLLTLAETRLETMLMTLPNVLREDVPEGLSDDSNVIQKTVGERDNPNAVPHYDLPVGLDFEGGVNLSGSRFTVLRGQAARLHRALGQFMLDTAIGNGFQEIIPPFIVNEIAMWGTGQLPKFGEDAYDLNGGEQWLIPTAEVSLTNLVAHSVLPMHELPLRMTALTPCFRREAGSAGRDTRGLLRQHQFEKVELVTICPPELSCGEHEIITRSAEMVLEALDLKYRRVLLCSGDTGFSAAMTYDLEVWMPGTKEWREISSCSNCLDFQARRMGARYRPTGQKGTEFVHTLNGSALAVGRALAAVLEQYWDGTGLVVPDALKAYVR